MKDGGIKGVKFPLVSDNSKTILSGRIGDALDLYNHILLTGYVPDKDLPIIYNLAALFLFPSLREGFGIAILEANSFCLPAIGATGCGIDDAISTKSGKLVDGNSNFEIVMAMQSVLAERELFSSGARKWAQKHNWSQLIDQII